MVQKQWNIGGVLKAQEQRLDDVLDLAAEIVVAEIKVRTTVDTGKLRSISPAIGEGTVSEKSGHLKRRVFNNTEYAPYVEFGTTRMEAQPFMRPGFRAAIPKINQLLRRVK